MVIANLSIIEVRNSSTVSHFVKPMGRLEKLLVIIIASLKPLDIT